MHRIARRMGAAFGVVALLGGPLVGLGAMATPAAAATTIGQTGADASIGCFGGGATSLVQVSTGSGIPSYVVPSGINEITSWSAQGGATTSLFALEIWQPTAMPGSYVLVGIESGGGDHRQHPQHVHLGVADFRTGRRRTGPVERLHFLLLLCDRIWSGRNCRRVRAGGVVLTARTRHHRGILEPVLPR